MFNNKYKQRIAELETTNAQLQANYDLLLVMLEARQDDCVTLQRQLATAQPVAKATTLPVDFEDSLNDLVQEQLEPYEVLSESFKDEFADNIVDSVVSFIEELLDSDSDEDEDEDEDD